MYVWVVLAVFIVALHCFNLSVRSDMRSIYVEPQAESSITKIIMQHRAAREYLTYEIANKSNPYPQGEIDLSNLDEFLPTSIVCHDDSDCDHPHAASNLIITQNDSRPCRIFRPEDYDVI